MNDIDLYKNILGIQLPWEVTGVQLSLKDKTVTIHVSYTLSEKPLCSECNASSSIYDHNIRRWRHLDTCQMMTIIECNVPRISCPEHGVKQVPVPWAEANSHFTALFELLTIHWLKETSISGVAKLLGLTWDQTAGIQERAVQRGLSRRADKPMVHVGIDETSFQKKHEYVTTIYDKDEEAILDVLDDRTSETLEQWFKTRPEDHRRSIETISMDMWDPYILAVTQTVSDAKDKICFDRFHVAQHFGKALNKVRAQEHRIYLNSLGESPLAKTKYDWLINASGVDNRTRRDFMTLTRSALKTARAWAIKETAAQLWNFTYRASAEKAWKRLLGWISRCRLEPVIKVGSMIRNYFWGIINAILAKTSNAVAESKNARIQRIKKMACGFRNRKRFRMAIMFHLGKLDMMPKSLCYSL